MKSENTIPSLEKAVALLEYLGRSENGATQQELARELKITPSTCYRIIQTLNQKDWVRRQPNNTYTISGGILMAAMKLVNRVARFESAQPVLERLSAQTGLSCKLSIRQGEDQVTVLRAESPRPMSISGKVGARFPIIEGSVGAALLSYDEREDILSLAENCREDIIEKTEPQIILDMADEVKAKGYCINSLQNRWRITAMSGPVLDRDGQVIAAITILGFKEDFEKNTLDELARRLEIAAAECAKLA
ncbi:MAG: IclR family transcriptional regulator [Planctomycetes bacterium]|nr:IclR family transcriptional regulator [Planctomycetota bacterium]